MFERLRAHALRVLRVPLEPAPPAGAPGSVRIFRAGRNYYKLRLARWGLGQAGALAGIIFSLGFLARLEHSIDELRDEPRPASSAAPLSAAAPRSVPPAKSADVSPLTPSQAGATPTAPPAANAVTPGKRKSNRGQPPIRQIARKIPRWFFPLLNVLEWGGVLLYLAQIPITYALARLDFEMRWYIVTDRSLRIRTGLTTVLESTMSFANVQQVVVSQGPLQRLIGLADVRVQSAGGGGGGDEQHGAQQDSLHRGVFHAVENAHQIRDLILERLRLFREAGLGDPDEASVADLSAAGQTPAHAPTSSEAVTAARARAVTLTAAQELLAETRGLRRALS